MKIGLICPYNIFKSGGVQECVLALQSELSNRGHEVYIISPRPKVLPEQVPDNILMLGISRDIKSPLHTTTQVSVSVDMTSVDEVLERYDFDILHFHEPWVPLVSRQILSRSKAKNIATFHAKLPDTVMSRSLEKIITPYTKSVLKDLDLLTAVSDAGADYVKSLSGNAITIIPNGIDTKKYTRSTGTTSKSKIIDNAILYIGRLEKRKGVKYLIKAFALVFRSNPSARLIIAGDGPDRSKLEQYVIDKEIEGIEFMGYINEDTKLDLLSKCRVFCSPAVYGESFGIVLLEAMSMGMPIVAGNNPGYASVMKETGRLSLVNPRDISELANRLQLFLEDEALREIWKDWAKKYVSNFDYTKVVDQYENVYANLLKTDAQA
jgi:phosphatidylinositol alpha-mannosyltransferase